ncbi:uncharacterized protein K452DRAFT_287000 [Aplosporella prunicola CBS 121167]|uniref:DUF1857-domain-containing protein n=1 Tax=Aplosporella prunicola CBS 121167 TaxID=1176127 RepID=A0A6A6BEJ1_9PEZI|nr:uncharacterized protein K452DRAFT_287000 [Aplosporella prunicola CBS 121167]KAF2142579.1 hypothetical protein K452DRAFT_287000 [Aplosporella prunicola CBS 121167]
MVTHHLAYTAPINPALAEPHLSQAQVWQGLRRKMVAAQEFVPAITDCRVLEEKGDGEEVTREVVFREGAGPGGDGKPVREVCRAFEPTRVDFHQTDGSVVRNIISTGAGGEADLYMTYVFEWHHPQVTAGSDEDRTLLVRHNQMAQMAVEKSIESIRKMVVDGRIK